MALRRAFRPTNRRIRILVGLLLAGLFCIQCTGTSDAVYQPKTARTISAEQIGRTGDGELEELVALARTDHVALLERSLERVKSQYHDYTCTLVKHEVVNGQDKGEQSITVKHRTDPFSVAMAWTENPPMGDRVLYVEGKYGDQMLVRPTNGFLRALVPTAQREPGGPDAMKNTLRPVSRFGFLRGLESLLDVYRTAADRGELEQSFGGYAQVDGRETLVLVRELPARDDYPAARTLTYIDIDRLIPICIEGYNWDGEFSCRYVYRDVKLNVGLTTEDFQPEANDLQSPS